MMTRVFSSLASAASIAALDSARLTDMGMICDGNNTPILSGSTGYAFAFVAESVMATFL
jgi:hypothetical protein